ncbi:MAG: zinc ribbon domain-containing protein [Candidatus Roizmanbacteria bacterium]|nr:zinc ribbon domain-containing protein [Candidatus Roizmanbacteria bacterium]
MSKLTKKCPACQKDVPTKIYECPHCQKDLRIWTDRHPLLTGLFIILVIVFFITRVNGDKKKTTISITPVKQEKQIPKTPKEQIRGLIQKNIEGKNNMGWPYEESIEITQESDGKYSIDIKFNTDDNLSKGMIKTGIQMKTSEILTALFTQREDIQKVTVSALFPLQDKYGNPFRGEVYIAEMDVIEAEKVNWSIDQATLALSILPKVYKIKYPYKIF